MDRGRASSLFGCAVMALSCAGFGDSEVWSAGAVSGALSAGGIRPRAILAVFGPSFTARTRPLRDLKNGAKFPGSLLAVASVRTVSFAWPSDSTAAAATLTFVLSPLSTSEDSIVGL